MVRKRKAHRDPSAMKMVAIHPELHKTLAREALDSNQYLWERLHEVLCGAMDREDLRLQHLQAAAAST